MGVVKTCGSLTDVKRPEHALKLFIRFAIAKGVVTYGMDLMLALFDIAQGVMSTIMQASGVGSASKTTLPDSMVSAIEDCGFFESIPLWAVTLIGTLVDMTSALFNPERVNLLDRDEPLAPDEVGSMYVLTNESGSLGAATLFYPDVKEKAAELLGSDYYILPSSVHETILVPDSSQINAKELCDMVKQANRTVVDEKDILSDNVYHYSRDARRLDKVSAEPNRSEMVAEAR